MMKIPVPLEKIQVLQKVAGITDEAFTWLIPCREVLLENKEAFSARLEESFLTIPGTRVFLEHEEVPGHLRKVWEHWYATLIGGKSIHELIGYLWQVGLKHVEVNLEQSYTNAGFAVARVFLHEVLEREFPPDQAFKAVMALDRMLDLCLLVETQAYIENLSSCDMDMMGGIADKVRNPVTVIGGNIRRLMKGSVSDNELGEAYETIIHENARLEQMVGNIKHYIELFRREPEFLRVSLAEALERTVVRFRETTSLNVELHMDDEAAFVTGSPLEIEDMFYYLLQSCAEDPGFNGNPILVSTSEESDISKNIRLSVFCPGSALLPGDTEILLHPFASKGSKGTGFGLPTALLSIRKNHGRFQIKSSPDGGGAELIVVLPSGG